MTTLFARLLRPNTSIHLIPNGIPTRPKRSPIEVRRQSRLESSKPLQPRTSSFHISRKGKRFSPQEDAHIIQRRHDGATTAVIAAELPGRKVTSIRNRCQVLGSKQLLQLRRRRAPLLRSQPSRYGQPFTQADENILLERFTAGVPIRQISIELGRTKHGVESYLEKLRSTGQHALESRCPKQPFTPVQDQQMLTLRSQGSTIRNIAKEMGRSHGVVEERLLFLRSRGPQQDDKRREGREQWTNDEVDNLVESYKSGKRIIDIAGPLKKSYGAVKSTLYRELEHRGLKGLRPKLGEPWTPAEDAQLAQLRQVQKLPWEKVAGVIGRTKLACQARLFYHDNIKKKS